MSSPVALITGGATGIGKEVALQLAREGATIVIAGRRTADGEAAAAEIHAWAAAGGRRAQKRPSHNAWPPPAQGLAVS